MSGYVQERMREKIGENNIFECKFKKIVYTSYTILVIGFSLPILWVCLSIIVRVLSLFSFCSSLLMRVWLHIHVRFRRSARCS